MDERKETWSPIIGFEDRYEVSDMGRIRSSKTGRIRKAFDNGIGYERIVLCKDSTSHTFYVHRLVAKAFVLGVGPEVNHKDCNKKNNAASNLEWTDRRGNSVHAWANERQKRTVTADRICEMEAMRGAGVTFAAIAAKHGVSISTAWKAAKGVAFSNG